MALGRHSLQRFSKKSLSKQPGASSAGTRATIGRHPCPSRAYHIVRYKDKLTRDYTELGVSPRRPDGWMSRHKGGSVKAGCVYTCSCVCMLQEKVLDDLTRWEKPRGKREECALEKLFGICVAGKPQTER